MNCNKKPLESIISSNFINSFTFNLNEGDFTRKLFWTNSPERYSEFITLDLKVSNEPIGTGGYGEIFLCQDVTTDKFYVLKNFNEDLRELEDISEIKNKLSLIHNERKTSLAVSKNCFENTIINKIVYDTNPEEFMYDWTERSYSLDIIEKKNHIYLLSSPVGLSLFDFYFTELFELPINLVPIKHSMICQLLHILHCLYKSKINHCDLKPENIVVLRDGTLILIDYGSSYVFDTTKLINSHTPQYSPPEKCRNHKSDVYSLGMIINYILFIHPEPEKAYTPLTEDGIIDISLVKDARLFIQKLTQKKNSDRPTIEEIFTSKEPWNNWFNRVFSSN